MVDHTEEINYLRTPQAIRERTGKIFELCKAGQTHFEYHPEKLEEVSDFVLEVIKENYPELEIPFHSRWGHFKVGGFDRVALLEKRLSGDALEKARTKLDLVITSVLLDAGAGPTWNYFEKNTGESFSRSEGLGVASFHMFCEGYFSSDKSNPFRADGEALRNLVTEELQMAFQVKDSNPLVGAAGRTQLINRLGQTVLSKTEFFKNARPGNIVDYLIDKHGESFEVQDILQAVLLGLGDIWPSRLQLDDTNLGDVWRHQGLVDSDPENCLVPFHKLSQWLTYSLVEPMIEAGLNITGAEKLTGLAEYRNGGLILDSGLVTLRDSSLRYSAHTPDSDLIIEWRALTIQLLDLLADRIREKLGFTPENFPLAKVLEGGTWWAGRKIAKSLREDSSPPLQLDSDGTVF
jgi:hypothetical protein